MDNDSEESPSVSKLNQEVVSEDIEEESVSKFNQEVSSEDIEENSVSKFNQEVVSQDNEEESVSKFNQEVVSEENEEESESEGDYESVSEDNQEVQPKKCQKENVFASAQFEARKLSIQMCLQHKLMNPADYLIIFSKKTEFLKQSRFVRMLNYTQSYSQGWDSTNFKVQDPETLQGFANQLVIIHQNIVSKEDRNCQEKIDAIQTHLISQIVEVLEYFREKIDVGQIKSRVMIASNSIYPEIFDLSQQAELFVKALMSLKDSKNMLEISILSQNKFEFSMYLRELIKQPDSLIDDHSQEHPEDTLKQQIDEYDYKGQNVCPKGHVYEFQTNLGYNQCIYCEEYSHARYKCRTCFTSACIFCVKISIKKFECPKKHVLRYQTSDMRGHYLCDECLIESDHVHNGVWFDKVCRLDICGYCMRENIEVGLVQKKIYQLQVLKDVYGKLFRPEILEDFGQFLNNETLKY